MTKASQERERKKIQKDRRAKDAVTIAITGDEKMEREVENCGATLWHENLNP